MTCALNDLKELIARAKCVLKNFNESVGWKESDNEYDKIVVCPINSNHLLPEKSLAKHVRRCKWRSLNYSMEEVNEIITAEDNPCSGPSTSLDDVISKVSPGKPLLRTHEAYVSNLTREERLQIYNEIASKFRSDKPISDDSFLYKNLNEKSTQESSLPGDKSNLEIVKDLRDHKRRRQSYRAKNVHVTKRSQTEVLREVLSIHMEELRQQWNPHLKHETTEPSLNEKHFPFDRSEKKYENDRQSEVKRKRHTSSSPERSDKSKSIRKFRRYEDNESCRESSNRHSRHRYQEKKYEESRTKSERKKKHKSRKNEGDFVKHKKQKKHVRYDD